MIFSSVLARQGGRALTYTTQGSPPMIVTCSACGRDVVLSKPPAKPPLCKACSLPGRDNLPSEMRDRHALSTLAIGGACEMLDDKDDYQDDE